MIYVAVAVNIPSVSGVFHYHLPPELEEYVRVGHLVIVPFGRQTVQGVVVHFVDQPEVSETRPVLDVVDPAAVLTVQQIALAERLAHDCLAPLAACISLMLPAGLGQQADLLYTQHGASLEGLSITQSRLLSLLAKRGPLRGQQLDRAFPRADWRASARPLIRRGLLSTQPVLPEPKVRPRHIRTALLACSADFARAALPDLGRPGTKALERRQAMLQHLIRESGPVEAAWLYAESGGNLQDLRFLEQRGLVYLGEAESLRDPLSQIDLQPYRPPALTHDQRQVWDEVRALLHQAILGQEVPPVLLYGVTGSGKTEIYLHAVQEALDLGRQVIVLVPEIALTPQTIRRFAGRFPGRVGLIHSGLSDGERYDTWRRARSGDLGLVVGPRSALFTPFEHLSLIIVDECHDDTYYQGEAVPHYHAREAALTYAQLTGALCLLGSATPDIVSYYRGQQSGWRVLHLPERILAHREAMQAQIAHLEAQEKRPAPALAHYHSLEADVQAAELPPVRVVDMRQELKDGNRSIFSRSLQDALRQVLDQSEQAILFLNRRGSATFVFCRDCGHTLKCPRCDIPLTFHEAQNLLLCHYCGYQRRMPEKCPVCGSLRIRQYGTGTQRVETEVQALFPGCRTLRWDYETTRKKGAHEHILSHFMQHRADILIGTQMLAKGLDLPLVTLVGVVLADVGLSLPDYRTNERLFQVLTQVAGRAGRSPLGGQVILQTFQPEHYVIRAAAQHDYRAFYTQELIYRRKLGYPPFARLVRLEYRHTDPQRVERLARELATQLQRWVSEENRSLTRLIGPAPCFFARIGGLYRWQIVLAGPDPASLLVGRPLGEWKIEVNPPSLL